MVLPVSRVMLADELISVRRDWVFWRPGVDMSIRVRLVQPARRNARATAWPIPGVRFNHGCSGGWTGVRVWSGGDDLPDPAPVMSATPGSSAMVRDRSWCFTG